MNSLHCCASVLEVVGLIRALIGLLPAVPGVAQELEHLARDGVPEGAIELSAAVPGVAQASSQPAPVASSTDPGIIAYVRRSTYDIHVVSPDGSDDRVLWTAPQPLTVWPAFDLAWRPDGRELAFPASTRRRARGTRATCMPSATMAPATGASPTRRPAPSLLRCPRAR